MPNPRAFQNSPAYSAALANLHDTNPLTNGTCRSLYIGTTGNVRVLTANGEDVLFTAVPVGVLPVSVQKVFSTNTTASNIVALY